MNSPADPQPLNLVSHPETPARAVQGIEARVATAPGKLLTLAFALHGDISGLRIPVPGACRRADGLWRHTCFEVFATGDSTVYREFNFSPSGEWAAYAFRGYRDGCELCVASPPAIKMRRTAGRLEVDVEISQDYLPAERPLRLGLSAVVEDADGVLSCWALRHAPGRPDFHHSETFAMQLVLP